MLKFDPKKKITKTRAIKVYCKNVCCSDGFEHSREQFDDCKGDVYPECSFWKFKYNDFKPNQDINFNRTKLIREKCKECVEFITDIPLCDTESCPLFQYRLGGKSLNTSKNENKA